MWAFCLRDFGGQEYIRRVQGWIAAEDKRILLESGETQFEGLGGELAGRSR
jgi:hypothetical protein